MSKQVIQLQIDNTGMAEKMEINKFDLGNQLVTSEREIEQLEGKLSSNRKSNEYLRTSLKVYVWRVVLQWNHVACVVSGAMSFSDILFFNFFKFFIL